MGYPSPLGEEARPPSPKTKFSLEMACFYEFWTDFPPCLRQKNVRPNGDLVDVEDVGTFGK